MEERDDYIPEQKGNEKRITPFERFVPGIRHAARNRDMSIQCSRDEGNKIVGFCGVMKESAFGAP